MAQSGLYYSALAVAYDLYQYNYNPSMENAVYAMADLVDHNPVPTRIWTGGVKKVGAWFSKPGKGEKAVEGLSALAHNARGGIESASLGNKEARLWYINHLKQIPDMIDKSLPLEQQAKQAYELRNSFKSETRDLVLDKYTADKLDLDEPLKTWEELYNQYYEEGFRGDQIYQAIIDSSQRTRESVNAALGFIKGIDY